MLAKTMNSAAKLTRPGSPRDARKPMVIMVAAIGIILARPPRLGIILVPALCWTTPHIMNRTAVTSP